MSFGRMNHKGVRCSVKEYSNAFRCGEIMQKHNKRNETKQVGVAKSPTRKEVHSPALKGRPLLTDREWRLRGLSN